MDSSVISVENLGKCYRIGLAEQRPKNLREALHRAAAAPFRYLRTRMTKATESELIWALKDISFDLAQGEVLGIIGRNGAGKSTLLKILSRITDPSEGRAVIRGRVNSLLKVGTGFHPELTGRENIFMNAAMHGMRRAEIKRKLGDIIEFAEIAKFADTPVKRYSSGMYMRLAFAVAAHLDPDILIVDEVLAVGDAAFQKKCIGKMNAVAHEGRTVLFVSHNMQAVNGLCGRALWLDGGRACMMGDAGEVVKHYLELRITRDSIASWPLAEAPGNDASRILAIRVLNEAGAPAYDHDIARPVRLQLDIAVLKPAVQLNTSFHVLNHQGVCLFAVGSAYNPELGMRLYETGCYRSECEIPSNFLNEGVHQLNALVVQDQLNIVARADEAVAFQVHDYGARRGGFTGHWIGAIRPLLPWSVQRLGNDGLIRPGDGGRV
jgi:lipopolysaccharide transport system ATP-binding protein